MLHENDFVRLQLDYSPENVKTVLRALEAENIQGLDTLVDQWPKSAEIGRLNLVMQDLADRGYDKFASWPPPERLDPGDLPGIDKPLVRVSYSRVSDDQIKTMTHVARGAQYEVLRPRPS